MDTFGLRVRESERERLGKGSEMKGPRKKNYGHRVVLCLTVCLPHRRRLLLFLLLGDVLDDDDEAVLSCCSLGLFQSPLVVLLKNNIISWTGPFRPSC